MQCAALTLSVALSERVNTVFPRTTGVAHPVPLSAIEGSAAAVTRASAVPLQGAISMIIEKSGFLLMAGTLAAGGVGGWLVHDSKARQERTVVEAPTTLTTASAVPAAAPVVVVETPPLPLCDDSVGTPEDCPAVGPSDEGVCSNIAAKRCADFKLAFKPKVAQAAVSCLRHLKGNELCDPARVNLCGHAALMAACPDVPPPAAPGTTASANATADSSPVAMACDSILKTCGAEPLRPTQADCRQTLAGMTDTGRANMAECMSTHCGDKGLLGCEGLKKP